MIDTVAIEVMNILSKNDEGIFIDYIHKHPEFVNRKFQQGSGSFFLFSTVIERRWVRAAHELIGLGMRLNVRDRGLTPLMHACVAGIEPVVVELIASGADVNQVSGALGDDSRFTAVMFAAEGGDLSAVRKLIASGADLTIVTKKNRSALWYAVKYTGNKKEIVKLLLEAKCKLTGEELHLPAYRRELEIVELLLGHGCPVNNLTKNPIASHRSGSSCLHLTVGYSAEDPLGPNNPRRFKILKMLLEAGAKPDIPSPDGWTPLMDATKAKDIRCAELLVHAGADPNFCPPHSNYGGKSPVSIAAENNFRELEKLFVRKN